MGQEVSWVVMKFGGTSVASAPGWKTIEMACRHVLEEGHRPLVVCSALAGVSNALESLIEHASAGKDCEPEVARLRKKHEALAADLGVPLPDEVSDLLGALSEILQGVRLLGEASPRVRARVMSAGELMSTHLGTAWLNHKGLPATWTDARTLLTVEETTAVSTGTRYLSARVEAEPGAARKALSEHQVVLTQGFIASDEEGDTVLLGRGGSDTSAAYLGVLVDAVRVEIWTDVPGLFTANPTTVDAARHLAELGYDEVATMASLGARVLHPRCVEPALAASVPIHVRSTYHPDEHGTVVDGESTDNGIKAVTSRKGLVLLRMCRPSQWQPVGFVADVSACFKRHGLSIDMMSTAPSTIAATVDPASAPSTSLDALIADLSDVADVEVETQVASVSLVGTGVRETGVQIRDAIAVLDDVAVRMVVQGAADHHLTFVVAESAADSLVARLHAALFANPAPHEAPAKWTPASALKVHGDKHREVSQ